MKRSYSAIHKTLGGDKERSRGPSMCTLKTDQFLINGVVEEFATKSFG